MHWLPAHTATAFAGVVQAAQAPPQNLKLGLHSKPHAPPSQVALAFAGGVHGVQALPQLLGEVLGRHCAPQR